MSEACSIRRPSISEMSAISEEGTVSEAVREERIATAVEAYIRSSSIRYGKRSVYYQQQESIKNRSNISEAITLSETVLTTITEAVSQSGAVKISKQ